MTLGIEREVGQLAQSHLWMKTVMMMTGTVQGFMYSHQRAFHLKALTGKMMWTLVSFPNFSPLSPKSDKHQFSPNNTQSRVKVVRINKMITREKML